MNPNRSRRHRLASFLAAPLLCALAFSALNAQTHKVAKPENVVRAIAIYEWTGDMAKPTASRLIPISLFIDGKLEDAAVYLSRPVPFALAGGNVYELDQTGVALGTFTIAFSRHLVPVNSDANPYDDGWFGYGKFLPPAPHKPSTLKPSKKLVAINSLDEDDDQPHFSTRSATPGSGDAATPTSGSSAPASDTPADDPNRPTLHRSASSSNTTATGNANDSSATKNSPADDPDRPTLRRRSSAPSQSAAAGPSSDAVAALNAVATLNDDPNRPLLHHGKPISALNEDDIPKLAGLPPDSDLHQMVAVSDAVNRPTHDFSRAWDDESEHQAILAKMQAAARAQLATYEAANTPAAPVAMAPPDTRHPNSKLRHSINPVHATPPPATLPTPEALPAPAALLDEQLKGYTLSYGGAATYVYSAHTDGLGSSPRYVTLVAQVDINGEPRLAIQSVTDAAHLDRTPRLRLVDAVDAEASNRASLLFELRAQHSRQFALYRVIGSRADQTFLTGSTQ